MINGLRVALLMSTLVAGSANAVDAAQRGADGGMVGTNTGRDSVDVVGPFTVEMILAGLLGVAGMVMLERARSAELSRARSRSDV